MSRKIKPPKLGHVVDDCYIGHTHVLVCDDCVVKTPEEVQAILDHINDLVVDAFTVVDPEPEHPETEKKDE